VRRALAISALAALALVALAGDGWAQSKTGTTVGTFLKIEPDARIAGMGNAGVSAGGGLTGYYYNPAAVALIDKKEVRFSHSAWIADIAFDHIAAAFPLGKAGTAAVTITSLRSGDISVRTVDQPLGTGELFHVSDFAAGAGWARPITDRFSIGAEAMYVQETIWNSSLRALVFHLGTMAFRSLAWRNVLRAAYPDQRIPFLPLAAAYLFGAGVNAIVPAHAGDVTKVFLVKRQIPNSSYPAVTSSFLVQTVFDTSVGILVLLYAITQGLLPPLPRIPDLPAFEIAFWVDHPQVLAITVGVLLIAIVVGIYLLAHRVRRFWARVKQGVAILTEPRRYFREVFAWQGVGWLCRFAAFWFFLEAFGIGGSIGNVMLVMSVQAIANIVPFTPGGAGAQQALLVATLHGPTRAAVLSFSVGTQIAMAAWSVVLAFTAMLLVFRTTDWRGLIQQAQDERAEEEGEEREAEAKAPV
jgi:uncharacterized protein (TIRG00374 family)